MEPAQDHCEMCFDETAVGFCNTCGYIGKACLGIHKKGRAFQTHIINIHDEGEEKTKMIMRDITEESCKEHPKDKAIFFCKAHDCMICGRCLHSGHLSCGKQVVDLLEEAGTIDYDKVNHMKQALIELRDDSLRLKEESRLKNETNEVQAAKCYKELDSLETRLKRSVEDIIRNVRNETCKYQDENIEAFSCISAVCDENVVWADEEEKQIEELVTNSFSGHLYLRSKTFNKAVSGPKLKMKENEHKQTFKIFCLKENEIALKCLFEDMRDVCHIQEKVDGSDDGSAVTHDVGNATSAIQKTRNELSDELIQVKRDLAKSEKTRKSLEQELLQARQVIEKSEKERNTSEKELLKAKQVIEQSEKTKKQQCDQLKQELDNSEKGRISLEKELLQAKQVIEQSEKARQKLCDELIQVKQELDHSEKMKKGYEAELLKAQQRIEKSEEGRKMFEKELLQAKQVIKQYKKASDTAADENCVICLKTITYPAILPCGHLFCRDCLEQSLKFKEVCPICGYVVGIVTGVQPPGKMTVSVTTDSCSGYPNDDTIVLKYEFADGCQTVWNACCGICKTGYIPNNPRGRKICRMLKVAFKRRLVFTIGDSRTTGKDGVIKWNYIHHKTDARPNRRFGYPDPTYLDRVTEELAAYDVTEKDIQDDDKLEETLIV